MSLNVSMDRHSLKIGGERVFILSGAMHYFRLPARELWPGRLALIKQAGFNAVDIYYAWNFHSDAPGVYDFSGIRDVDYLHKCIEDAGLYLIARPGPYICSEVDAGGFPGWLLRKKDITLRCRDRKGRVRIDNDFLKYTREWFEQIVPRINACKNLILFQVENEFNTLPYLQGPLPPLLNLMRQHDATLPIKLFGSDALRYLNFKIFPKLSGMQTPRTSRPNPYFRELIDMARGLGVAVPLFHNDIMSTSGRVTDVDLCAIDDYALNMYSDHWRGKRHVFAGTDIIEAGQDALERDEPIFIAEFQGGWFDLWGGRGYERIRKILGTDQLDIATKTALSQRATLINYFMFIGGTNVGYMGSPDVYTSSDMCAPVTEWGAASERWSCLKWFSEQIQALGPDFLETDCDASVRASNGGVDCRARKSKSGRRYVFLRNLTLETQKTRINVARGKFTLDPVSMTLLVFDKDKNLITTMEPYRDGESRARTKQPRSPAPPALENWTLAWGSPQIAPDYDDGAWESVAGGADMDMDMDSLGHHYGCVWYRGTYEGRILRLRMDARHCFSVFLNGKLAGSRDNFNNTLGAGPDFAETFTVSLPASFHNPGGNVLVILTESLGHNKCFEADDCRNPRGIVSLDAGNAQISWKWRGGLLSGETGMCPVLPPESFDSATKKTPVALPHTWEPFEQGVGLYETTFNLKNVFNPDMHALGLFIPEAQSKVFIYLNGMLIGRYWQEKGPQHKFYLPWGVLKPGGDNHLALAVWKRWHKGGLGRVRLELFD